MSRSIDIVFCVDVRARMSPGFNHLRSNILRFQRDFVQRMALENKRHDEMRIRVIFFSDLHQDEHGNLAQSGFFLLPEHTLQLETFFDSTRPRGAGNCCECGFKALALAMRSHWSDLGNRSRQVIALFTDGPVDRLGNLASRPWLSYRQELRPSWSELSAKWDKMPSSKRLLLWSPAVSPWSEILSEWENVHLVTSRAGHGLIELEYDRVVEEIAACV